MMGGALGGIEAWWLPAEGTGFWPLVSMGAILGGTMRSPLTGIVFAIELTRDVNMILPLLVAVTVAHAFTVLVLRRSILTEKVARRGLHLSREYATDPLETLFVRDVMRRDASRLRVDMPRAALLDQLPARGLQKRQGLYPVVGDQDRLLGVVTRDDLQRVVAESHDDAAGVAAVLRHHPVTAYPDESLRVVVYRMAKSGLTRLPVIGREGRRLVGMIALTDLLTARTIALDAEDKRERVFRSLGQK
jgi:CBS domain-containing protein